MLESWSSSWLLGKKIGIMVVVIDYWGKREQGIEGE